MKDTTGQHRASGPADGAPRHYWDRVGDQWLSQHPDRLWRSWSDAIHAHWLERVAAVGGRAALSKVTTQVVAGKVAISAQGAEQDPHIHGARSLSARRKRDDRGPAL